MSDSFFAQGLRFECTQCGHCCRHEPGYVFLSESDIQGLLEYLSASQDEFMEKYCRMVDVGFFKRISLVEKRNNDCVFWQNGLGCGVYSARPLQCRSYPFWHAVVDSEESWKEESDSCPGMNHGRLRPEEEIRAWLKKREDNRPLDMDS